MINKRIKAGILKAKKPQEKIPLSIGSLALVLLCTALLAASAFIHIKPHFDLSDENLAALLNVEYIPQAPAVIFTAALLGKGFGVFAVLLYVLLGLSPWFPVFALGGGLDYIFQYTFGYIAAFIPAAYFSACGLKSGSSFINKIIAVLFGIFIIHISGILFYLCQADR